MIKRKYLVLVKKIKMIRITQEQYFLNSTQPFLDSEINSKKIRSLNLKQRQIFDFIYNWAKPLAKVKCGTTPKQSTPFHVSLGQ